MNRLYWKIVLTEGLLLVLVVIAAIWTMRVLHQTVESQRELDRNAAIELLRIGLRNDLPQEVSISNLERITSHMLKSHVQIITSDSPLPPHGLDEIHFKQNGAQYKLIISSPAGRKENHKGFIFPVYEKYIGILLLFAIAFSLLAIPLARIVTKPLGKLKQDMRQFASGDLSHRTKVTSQDEVGEVARDFNEMADSIQNLVRVGKEMTAHVSHELRSPLTRIDIARQLLEEHANEKQNELLTSMREEIEGMDALIDRILRLSRLDLNESKATRLCLVEIVKESAKRLIDSFEVNNIHCITNFPTALPLLGVKEDLSCLIDNLLNNALKFTPSGGNVEVELSCNHGTASLSVTNDASKPTIETTRLTEPFQRGDASESIPGSGLGLAIVKRVVKNHKGAISLLWNNGKFIVSVELPCMVE